MKKSIIWVAALFLLFSGFLTGHLDGLRPDQPVIEIRGVKYPVSSDFQALYEEAMLGTSELATYRAIREGIAIYGPHSLIVGDVKMAYRGKGVPRYFFDSMVYSAKRGQAMTIEERQNQLFMYHRFLEWQVREGVVVTNGNSMKGVEEQLRTNLAGAKNRMPGYELIRAYASGASAHPDFRL